MRSGPAPFAHGPVPIGVAEEDVVLIDVNDEIAVVVGTAVVVDNVVEAEEILYTESKLGSD